MVQRWKKITVTFRLAKNIEVVFVFAINVSGQEYLG
jgi:hypothetical protein